MKDGNFVSTNVSSATVYASSANPNSNMVSAATTTAKSETNANSTAVNRCFADTDPATVMLKLSLLLLI